MSIEELEQAVAKLPPDELTSFAAWFDLYRHEHGFDDWDRQMAADAGKFDKMIEQAKADHRAGKSTRLP